MNGIIRTKSNDLTDWTKKVILKLKKIYKIYKNVQKELTKGNSFSP